MKKTKATKVALSQEDESPKAQCQRQRLAKGLF